VAIEGQQQREHAARVRCSPHVIEFPHPDGVPAEIAFPHLAESLDAREEVVPLDSVALAVRVRNVVDLEFVQPFI
jgi:hypothetical protein